MPVYRVKSFGRIAHQKAFVFKVKYKKFSITKCEPEKYVTYGEAVEEENEKQRYNEYNEASDNLFLVVLPDDLLQHLPRRCQSQE
jgi:hypothetical protein